VRQVLADQRGTVTLWVLGLAIAMLGLGGLSVDLWRIMAERAEVAVIADSAAVAGASGVDVPHFRSTGEILLDPGDAVFLADQILAGEDVVVRAMDVGAQTMVVELEREVPFTLLRVLTFGQETSLTVAVIGRATALGS